MTSYSKPRYDPIPYRVLTADTVRKLNLALGRPQMSKGSMRVQDYADMTRMSVEEVVAVLTHIGERALDGPGNAVAPPATSDAAFERQAQTALVVILLVLLAWGALWLLNHSQNARGSGPSSPYAATE